MEEEIKRLTALLRQIDPTHPNYHSVLENLRELVWLRNDLAGNDAPKTNLPVIACDAEPKAEKPVPAAVKAEEPKAEEPEETEEEKPAEDSMALKDSYTKEEVREYLSFLTDNGFKIKDYVIKYVPEGKPAKFSSIAAKDYAAFVKELKEAYDAR